MGSSPFRDDREALRSVIEALQRENEALSGEVSLLRAEVDGLRAATPENQQAFARRLQEINDELRKRVAELEPLEGQVREYQRRLRFTEDRRLVGEFFRRLFRISSDR
jgi:chromosome segregation ATPase